MRKEDILREELSRMRQLMGMNGSLYQKPIVGEDVQDARGHMAEPPNAKSYKGGEESEAYQADLSTYNTQHPPKSPPPSPPPPSPPPPSPPPPSPPPSPKSNPKNLAKRSVPKKGTGASSALDSGAYVLPASMTPGAKGSIGGRAKSKTISRKVGSKKVKQKGRKKREDR